MTPASCLLAAALLGAAYASPFPCPLQGTRGGQLRKPCSVLGGQLRETRGALGGGWGMTEGRVMIPLMACVVRLRGGGRGDDEKAKFKGERQKRKDGKVRGDKDGKKRKKRARAEEGEEEQDSEWEGERKGVHAFVGGDGVGAKLMEKMGYIGGGLGSRGQGIEDPIKVEKRGGKAGLGKQPEDTKKKQGRKAVTLFSDEDSGDDAMDEFGSKGNRKRKEWKKKVKMALGEDIKVRIPKKEREALKKDFDPNDDEQVEEFIRGIDERYDFDLDARPSEISGRSGRTDWRDLDQMTRTRKGMRGVGEAKQSTLSYDRKMRMRKQSVFALREKYRNFTSGTSEQPAGTGKLAKEMKWSKGDGRRKEDERDFVQDVMEEWKDDEKAIFDGMDADEGRDNADGGVPGVFGGGRGSEQARTKQTVRGEHFAPTVPYIDLEEEEDVPQTEYPQRHNDQPVVKERPIDYAPEWAKRVASQAFGLKHYDGLDMGGPGDSLRAKEEDEEWEAAMQVAKDDDDDAEEGGARQVLEEARRKRARLSEDLKELETTKKQGKRTAEKGKDKKEGSGGDEEMGEDEGDIENKKRGKKQDQRLKARAERRAKQHEPQKLNMGEEGLDERAKRDKVDKAKRELEKMLREEEEALMGEAVEARTLPPPVGTTRPLQAVPAVKAGPAGMRHQSDPGAIDKLLREPLGGYTEPKGGWDRWAKEQAMRGMESLGAREAVVMDMMGGMEEGVDEEGRDWKRPGDHGGIERANKGRGGRLYGVDLRDGLVPHEGWRPSVGYTKVDTSSVDSLRPLHQRNFLAEMDAREEAERQREAARRAARSRSSITMAGRHDFEFSHTEYIRHQAALKNQVRELKEKAKFPRKTRAPAPPSPPLLGAG